MKDFPKSALGVNKTELKTIVCTTPIRPVPTDYPPIASLMITSALRKAGYPKTDFYNIDLIRPSFEQVIEHFVQEEPHIIGVSAVVSTAYDYVKKLTTAIKEKLPHTVVVLGGNLGASAEIVLRKTGVDFICTGEGEIAMVDLLAQLEAHQKFNDFKDVKGFAYIDERDEFVFTEYPTTLSKEEIYDVDWSILEENNELDYFLIPIKEVVSQNETLYGDERLKDPDFQEKKYIIFPASKGCVARCTFCHRWDKGIRYIPIHLLFERIDQLMNQYNVGFISFGDENFGTDKRWLGKFLEEMQKRDLLWKVAGMRVNCITEEWMVRMKEAGCVSILYGMESGSPKILKVMEKMTTLEQNKTTLKHMIQHQIPTTIQLVLGMPGESPETIRETAEFAAYPTTLSADWDPNNLSINYAQALPGTPLYEHARRKGLIGQGIEEEEEYLLMISDRDARDGETTINFTDYPRLEYDCWHQYIQILARKTYIDSWGIDRYKQLLLDSPRFRPMLKKDSGYFAEPARSNEQGDKVIRVEGSETASNLEVERIEIDSYPSLIGLLKKRMFGHISVFYPRLMWNLRSFLWVMVIVSGLKKYNKKMILLMMREFLFWKTTSLFKQNRDKFFDYISLRKSLKKDVEGQIKSDPEGMRVIRLGR